MLRKCLASDKRLLATIFKDKRRKSTDAVSISVDWMDIFGKPASEGVW